MIYNCYPAADDRNVCFLVAGGIKEDKEDWSIDFLASRPHRDMFFIIKTSFCTKRSVVVKLQLVVNY